MKKKVLNKIKLSFPARSENERLSRTVIWALAASLDATLDDLADIRCAVSEAVTNAVVHAYGAKEHMKDTVTLTAVLYDDRTMRVTVQDKGCGIADIDAAKEPLYTTDTTGERSGMGFAIMQSFTDELRIKSRVSVGTSVTMKKHFAQKEAAGQCADAAHDCQATPGKGPKTREESA